MFTGLDEVNEKRLRVSRSEVEKLVADPDQSVEVWTRGMSMDRLPVCSRYFVPYSWRCWPSVITYGGERTYDVNNQQ